MAFARFAKVAILLSAAFAWAGGMVTDSFAATPAVAAEARTLWPWIVAIPLAGFAGFVLDGVFVGASWTRALLLSMAGAALGYGVMLWLTWPLGNHGLWTSFIGFLVLRAGLQLALMPRLLRREMA